MTLMLPMQMKFKQGLPDVVGNIDYKKFKNQLERISEIISLSGIDETIMQYVINEKISEIKKDLADPKEVARLNYKEQIRLQQTAVKALRCVIAKNLLSESYREFSVHLADSSLLQRFCQLDTFGQIKVPSKSVLQRYEQMFPEDKLREIICKLNIAASIKPQEESDQRLDLENAVSLNDYYIDSTCVKSNIHFPTDWVLLRDAVRTLMLATGWIRRHGLKNRMEEPKEFITQINRLSIQMTHSRYKKDSKKEQKSVLRLMKKLTKKVSHHAMKHREQLESHWQELGLKRGFVEQTLLRIDNVLNQLPDAIKQAHDRIIGERQTKSKDKILSLYEPDVHVLVRGKAGAIVEFGNTLVLGEQADGLILDWKLFKEQAPGDAKLLPESLERIKKYYGGYKPEQVTTDRGFYSKKNQKYLEQEGIAENMCPRSVVQLMERITETEFCRHQKRRGQTEGRIGILKNCFLGRPMRHKGFASREIGVAWSILAHNLWVIADLPKAVKQEEQYQKAA